MKISTAFLVWIGFFAMLMIACSVINYVIPHPVTAAEKSIGY